jgi:hypothetical protein
MTKEEKQKQVLLDVKRAFVLAKALNYQYIHIREDLSPELRKAVNEAKAKNSYFIKLIEDSFKKRKQSDFLDGEEELSFQLLEMIEQLNEVKNEIKDVNQQNLYTSNPIT